MTRLALARKVITLSDRDKQRLEQFAPLFDIQFRREVDGHYLLVVRDNDSVRENQLSAGAAYIRLLAELCEKTLRWVYFHPGAQCNDSLLSLTDAKLERVAELYRRYQESLGVTTPKKKAEHKAPRKLSSKA